MTGRGVVAAVAAIVALAAGAAPAGAIRAAQPSGGRPQLDVRAGQRAPVPAGVRAARRSYAEQLGIESHLATDPVGGGVRMLDRTNGFLSGRHAGDPAAIALAWARGHADVFGLTEAQFGGLTLIDRTTSNDGVTHLTWVPTSHGIPAYDSELRVHVTRDGRVLAASGPPIGGIAIPSATPALSASQALAVAQNDVGAPFALPRSTTRPGPQRETRFANGDHASLVAFQSPSGDRLAWRITVSGRGPYMYDEVIDAGTRAVLVRHSLTDFASSAHVFFYHPGAASGGSATQVDLSPWLTSTTSLSGPYAHAYADPNDDGQGNDGAPVDIPPSSGTDWEYPQTPVPPGSGQSCSPFGGGICTWDGNPTSGTELTNRAQVTTQVFWYVNNFHQWLAQDPIDFNDASGNFQVGGTGGSDPVDAETDDSILGTNPQVDNANMSTPPDGQSPRMQMYLFDSPFPAVNGGDDASVVYHEYTHGLSNRLIDNANGLNANQPRAMGEGWSDWYAMDYLVANRYVTDTAADGEVVVGGYATGETSHGIRYQPLDCSVGSSAPNCGGSPTTAHGGFTYADLGRVGSYNDGSPRFEVHDDGEIWSETLWDLRKALGAFTARKLITNAMRLSPADPSYLDERDAILLADEAAGGANHHAIWQVFATRGMGYGARTTSPNATRAIASFALPRLAEPAGAISIDDTNGLGDGDLAAEPGEAMLVHVALANPGSVALTNVHAMLSSSNAGVFVGQPAGDYGTIAPGGSAAPATPYAIALQPTVTCGIELPLSLHVTSDQGTIDLPLTLAIGGGFTTFTSAAAPQPIPDGSLTGVTSTVNVPTSGRVDDPRVEIDASHQWVGDLHAQLTSPSGTTVDLLERPGFGTFGSGLQWSNSVSGHGVVTFRDDATDSIQDIGDGPGALGPSYRPDESLSAFAGEDRAGTWTLHVTDLAAQLTGTLYAWRLDTDAHACATDGTLPIVVTGDATGASPTEEQLGGTVDRGGRDAVTVFEYGPTTAYGQRSDTMAHPDGSGQVDASMTVTGLAPATTYHYRLLGLLGGLDGPVVAAGADRTFTTAAVPSGGGGGSTGGSPGGGQIAGPPPSPIVSVSSPTRRATPNARDAFVFAFRATPGLRGTIRFTLPKHGRAKAILFGARSFTVGADGRVKLTIKLSRKALARLRTLHGASVRVTIVLDGRAFGFALKLSSPKSKSKPRRR